MIVKWSPTANWGDWREQLLDRRDERVRPGAGGREELSEDRVDKRPHAYALDGVLSGAVPSPGTGLRRNSRRKSDSAILADSSDGCSGSDLGLPYTTKARTCRTPGAPRSYYSCEEEARGDLTSPAGLTREAYLVTSVFYLLKRELHL